MQYESFGACLKRVLKEENLSASEVARLVGFRSRNSIFRILSGNASSEVKQRFMQRLEETFGSRWPQKHWSALREALSVDRLGPERYQANCAFRRIFQEQDTAPYLVHIPQKDGSTFIRPLAEELGELVKSDRVEIVLTGCCESALMLLLAECCGAAGAQGRLTIRHYIDTAQETISHHILGILPLVSKTWYNARLVPPDSCPPEMMAAFRLHAFYVQRRDADDHPYTSTYLLVDQRNFMTFGEREGNNHAVQIMDRWRFQLELLKPLAVSGEEPEVFVAYTKQYARLEDNCNILSIKPDVHFNCIPPSVLEPSIREGFAQAGMATGPELDALIAALAQVHEQRYRNMMEKHKVTHLVYSLPALERFMRTGVLSDQFFIQRAYTVEERRECIRVLLDGMRNHPYFHVHILKPDMPMPRYEISYYGGKGILLMDAYTCYDLNADHSEALVILPAFMDAFQQYFKEELLTDHVLSRCETIMALERLIVMNVQA
ncbi:MAG: helix-turn-helix domain-containing protein [Aristaeellaceae bacterium]